MATKVKDWAQEPVAATNRQNQFSEKKSKLQNGLWQAVVELSGRISLHGVGYVVNELQACSAGCTWGLVSVRAWRFAWIVIILLSCAGMLAGLGKTVRSYFSYETVVVTDVKLAKSLPLPAISICTHHFMHSHIVENNSNLMEIVELAEKMAADGIYDYLDYGAVWIKRTEYLLNMDNSDFEKLHIKSSDLIKKCEFNWLNDCSSHFKEYADGRFGVCFTLNADNESSKDILTTADTGSLHPLHIHVRLDRTKVRDVQSNMTLEPVLKVIIHQPHTLPLPYEAGIPLHRPTSVAISFTRKEIIRLPPPYTTQCLEDTRSTEAMKRDGTIFNTGTSYTVDGCRLTCRIRHHLNVCGCHYWSRHEGSATSLRSNPAYTDMQWTRLCNSSLHDDLNCTLHSFASWLSRGLDVCLHRCVPRCQDSYFTTTVFDRYVKRNLSDDEKVSNYFFEFYYDSMQYDSIKHKPAYELPAMFGDMGGLLGLTLGASVITLIELLQLGIVFCRYRYAC